MNDTLLRDTLSARAERVAPPDPQTLLAAVRERREHLLRRRRNALAAGGGSVVMAGLVAGTILLVPDHSGSGRDGGLPAGGMPSSAPTPASSSGTATSPAGPAPSSSHPASTTTSPPPIATSIVKIPPAPKSAPVSIMIVPRGWRFLVSADDATLYGPPGLKDPSDTGDFTGRLSVVVGERYASDSAMAARIGKYPASYSADSTFQLVIMNVARTRTVTIQAPTSAHLTKSQMFAIARTLEIRNLTHAAKG